MLCCFDVTVDDDGRAPTDDANQLLVARATGRASARVPVGQGMMVRSGRVGRAPTAIASQS